MTFEVVYNTALKIFSKLYVGVKPKDKENDVPLAFATPYEETAAGLKRQATVQGWVGTTTYDYKTRKSISFTPDLRVVDNVSMAGFKITDDIKRVYYGGGNVVWRLEHPLGWEIEIQSNNLMALIQGVGIQPGGVVNGECILARDGAHNVLLPVTSEEYKNAIKAAEGIKAPTKVPIKDRVIGRFYRLASGEYGQYMGKMYIRTGETEYQDAYHDSYLSFIEGGKRWNVKASCRNQIVFNDQEMKQYEVVYVPEHELGNEHYRYTQGGMSKLYASAPLMSELDQGSITKEEAEAIVNVNVNSMQWAGSGKGGDPIHASLTSECNVQFQTVPCPEDAFKKARKEMIKKAKSTLAHYKQQKADPHYSQYAKEAPKFTIADLFGSYSNEVEYQAVDGTIYTEIGTVDMSRRANGYGYGTTRIKEEERIVHIAGRILIQPNRLQRITIQGHGYDSLVSASSDQWQVGLIVQEHDTIEALEAAANTAFAEGRLVQIKTYRVTN